MTATLVETAELQYCVWYYNNCALCTISQNVDGEDRSMFTYRRVDALTKTLRKYSFVES